MSVLANGIAHVSFKGGGAFLPVRSPYDQQVLIEHVIQHARSKGVVQVLVGNYRWLIDGLNAPRGARCAQCGRSMPAASSCAQTAQQPCCVKCAIDQSLGFVPAKKQTRREGAYNQHAQALEADRGHGEEVHRDEGLRVSGEECPPYGPPDSNAVRGHASGDHDVWLKFHDDRVFGTRNISVVVQERLSIGGKLRRSADTRALECAR